ncbi:DUF6153 family protein [Streptomyces formicae]|uniref:Secreted protein n=1 Tax=Streptomyces formicae TaxID=1616117 RepID=A0ABY3WLN4_9ACTN|nr:DUF6153 family protein [Streptomyces formicae]UNM12247.1 hypothetical protein J4032_12515 [Streptomyces formicae]
MASSTGSSGRPAGRLFVLLVMAVLSGVLGMHALGPGGAQPLRSDVGHHMVMAHIADVPQVSAGCSHTDGGSDHLAHADGMCAAAGVGSAYAPPTLTSAVVDAASSAAVVAGDPTSTESDRSPPDLSELQLLRI